MNIGTNKKRRYKTLSDSFPKTSAKGILPSVVRAYLISIGIGTGMTLVCSAMLYSLSDPTRFITPTAFCILYISALLGGFLSAKFNRGSALLCGALYTIFMLGTMTLVSLLFGGDHSADHSLASAVGFRAIAMAMAIVGAMIGSHQKPKKRKKK
jgi:putative membrane protein (TIGR04086 family)